jgi:hypothetical protein
MSICISFCSYMSKAFAGVLREWLFGLFPGVVIDITPDHKSLESWLGAWIERLRAARVGMLCVTRDAIDDPTLYFHLGLIHRHIRESGLVAPIFLDVAPDDVSPTPLHMFQATRVSLTDFTLLVRQLEELVTPVAGSAEQPRGLAESWPVFFEQSRRIPATLDVFVVSIALPHRTMWFRYDPSGRDGDWMETIESLLPALAASPFGMEDIELGPYDCLDVDGEKWLQPPAIISRVGTSHIALVHPLVVEANGGSARNAAHAIRNTVDLSRAGLKVLQWKGQFVVGTGVM